MGLLFTAIIPYKIFGLDVILHIGTLRYEEHKTYAEIIKNAGNFMEKEYRELGNAMKTKEVIAKAKSADKKKVWKKLPHLLLVVI